MQREESLDSQEHNIFEQYIQMRDHYYKNMEKLIQEEEFRKASELLWGAITQAIKALASLSGIEIRSHGFFRRYTRNVSRETSNYEYHQLFLFLEDLHKNFYDEEIEPIDFPIFIEKANKFLQINDDLIQQKKKH